MTATAGIIAEDPAVASLSGADTRADYLNA
jgi:hypothetical protein